MGAMLRAGQYSLAYLFVESLWIALTVCFSRYVYLYAMDLRPLETVWGGPASMCAALFFMSVSVGGLFNFRGMWLGAAMGIFLMIVVGCCVVATMINR